MSSEEMVVDVTEELLDAARRELSRERWITPYKASQKLGIKISLAKRVLRILEEEGLIELKNKNRRSPIYVPKKG